MNKVLKMTALFLASVLLAWVGVLLCEVPLVRYDAGTHEPVSCATEDTDWEYVPVSDSRCQDAIEGRHDRVWVAPR